MSECVVRMEMPENCECCPMVYTADVIAWHTDGNTGFKSTGLIMNLDMCQTMCGLWRQSRTQGTRGQTI